MGAANIASILSIKTGGKITDITLVKNHIIYKICDIRILYVSICNTNSHDLLFMARRFWMWCRSNCANTQGEKNSNLNCNAVRSQIGQAKLLVHYLTSIFGLLQRYVYPTPHMYKKLKNIKTGDLRQNIDKDKKFENLP